MLTYKISIAFKRDSLCLAELCEFVTRADCMDEARAKALRKFREEHSRHEVCTVGASVVDGEWLE